MQGRWAWYEIFEDETSPNGNTNLHFFDFVTLSWSQEALIGERYQARENGLLAEHDGALVCMAGGALGLAYLSRHLSNQS